MIELNISELTAIKPRRSTYARVTVWAWHTLLGDGGTEYGGQLAVGREQSPLLLAIRRQAGAQGIAIVDDFDIPRAAC